MRTEHIVCFVRKKILEDFIKSPELNVIVEYICLYYMVFLFKMRTPSLFMLLTCRTIAASNFHPDPFVSILGLFENWDYVITAPGKISLFLLVTYSDNVPFPGYGYSVPNFLGLQRLAAFVMAVKEINNKSDGIADNLLPNTTVLIGYQQVQDSNFYRTVLGSDYGIYNFNYDVDITIGPSGNTAMKTSAQFYKIFQQFQIGFDSLTSELEDKLTYNNVARTCPDDSYEAYVIAHVICKQFNWQRVVVFSSTDSYGSSLLAQFQINAYEANIEIIESYVFSSGETNFFSILQDAARLGGYIYVLLMNGQDAGILLDQGYNVGLFKEGTQLIGVSSMNSPTIWQSMTSTSIRQILKGLIIPSPTLSYNNTRGRDFVKRWRKQPNTAGYTKNGMTYCNMETDDAYTPTYLYAYNGLCLGLNFSSFAIDGSDIDPIAAYVYDATFAAAHTMHDVVYNQKLPRQEASVQTKMNTLTQKVSFNGVSGLVSFKKGVGISLAGQGDRATDITYDILNFNELYLNVQRNATGFISTAKWNSLLQDFIPCYTCQPIVFRTLHNTIPYDRTPETLITLSSTQKNTLFSLGLVCFCSIIAYLFIILVNRSNRVIKAAQPLMLLLILLGGFIGAINVLLIIIDLSDMICVLQLWLLHLSFGFCFSSLIVKTWVVHKLVNSKMKKVQVRVKDALINFFIVIVLLFGILLLITFVGKPYLATTVTTDINKPLRYYYCSQRNPAIASILLVLEVCSLLVGIRLCWMIRNVPDALNESKYILSGII